MAARAAHVPGGFLNLPPEHRRADNARVFVLPIPYEQTVSYEEGTFDGPRALVHASQQVELYDQDFGGEPALSYGIYTLPPLKARYRSGQHMMQSVAAAAEDVIRAGKLLVSLGGEHSITPGLVRGVRKALAAELVVVQIDAHADLRDTYTGTRYSHGCAMRRCLEENPGPTVQLGIRSYSQEEADFIRGNVGRVNMWHADDIHADAAAVRNKVEALVRAKPVYLTIDVDGMDPSIIPATGTPEPGGLTWKETVDIIRGVAGVAEIVALDCVELAPRPGLHMADFAAAKLVYKAISAAMSRRLRP